MQFLYVEIRIGLDLLFSIKKLVIELGIYFIYLSRVNNYFLLNQFI